MTLPEEVLIAAVRFVIERDQQRQRSMNQLKTSRMECELDYLIRFVIIDGRGHCDLDALPSGRFTVDLQCLYQMQTCLC